jgi:hypothetical protein
VLVTLARSKAISSDKARLVPWTTLPSMQRLSRLLRAGPQGRPFGPHVDYGAGRAHAGMRLERPPAFRSRLARIPFIH